MIKTVILRSGLEILCEYEKLPNTQGNQHKVRLNKPFKIELAFIPQQDGNGRLSIMTVPKMVPMIHTTIQPWVDFDLADIAEVKDTNKFFTQAYVKQTTGLELAASL